MLNSASSSPTSPAALPNRQTYLINVTVEQQTYAVSGLPSSAVLCPGLTCAGGASATTTRILLDDESKPNALVSLIVPCLNEQDNIIPTLLAIVAAGRRACVPYEIIVVDDGSVDATGDRVAAFIASNPSVPIKFIRYQRNMGLSRAFVDGVFAATGEYCRIICGDNVETIDTIYEISFSMIGTADMILPYHIDNNVRSQLRRKLSAIFTEAVNFLSGYNIKYYNGCGLFRRISVMRWHPYTYGFGFQAELITRMLDAGATCVEVPVLPSERTSGASSALRLRNILSTLHVLAEIGTRRLRFKLFRN